MSIVALLLFVVSLGLLMVLRKRNLTIQSLQIDLSQTTASYEQAAASSNRWALEFDQAQSGRERAEAEARELRLHNFALRDQLQAALEPKPAIVVGAPMKAKAKRKVPAKGKAK